MKQFLKDSLGWGFLLWLIGYALGFVLFFVVSPENIGWFITPIGIVITFWVLLKKVTPGSIKRYLGIAFTWTIIAILFDYLFIVKALSSADYYKLDVYIYYVITFILPLIVGLRQRNK